MALETKSRRKRVARKVTLEEGVACLAAGCPGELRALRTRMGQLKLRPCRPLRERRI